MYTQTTFCCKERSWRIPSTKFWPKNKLTAIWFKFLLRIGRPLWLLMVLIIVVAGIVSMSPLCICHLLRINLDVIAVFTIKLVHDCSWSCVIMFSSSGDEPLLFLPGHLAPPGGWSLPWFSGIHLWRHCRHPHQDEQTPGTDDDCNDDIADFGVF